MKPFQITIILKDIRVCIVVKTHMNIKNCDKEFFSDHIDLLVHLEKKKRHTAGRIPLIVVIVTRIFQINVI